jgi:TRAP-type C4-dicarboxylate transport system permease small subunit
MVATTQANQGRFFGIQLGDFGFFTSILLSVALGFLAFFASCFLAIVGILIYNSVAQHSIDFADSYRYIALPVGLAVLAFSLIVLLSLWLRRKLSGN